jgi:hypothetical protein
VFKDFTYRTKASWRRERRVVGKAEHIAGDKANPRFVVTTLSTAAFADRALYETEYCGRGEMEKSQADYPSNNSWCRTGMAGNLVLNGVAGAGRVVSATACRPTRRIRMPVSARRLPPRPCRRGPRPIRSR